ncbi:MAG: ABC transporter ATP-binding protein [Anaerolineaceae bacterium]
MEPILRTESVTKIYDTGSLTVKAVDQVSLEIYPGEFVALVGPSGSGKTTMLAMLAGLLNMTQGSIRIDGHELGMLNEKEKTYFRREKIGFIFQANNLIPYLTALENVELMLRLNSTNSQYCRDEAKKLLGRLGLSDRLHNLPKQLSGGQQQRVAIARALIHDPSLVLADEPTAALDTERAYQVVQFFSELVHEQKRAGIMVTHDLRMTQHVDRVIQMVDGKIFKIIDDRTEIAAMSTGGRI